VVCQRLHCSKKGLDFDWAKTNASTTKEKLMKEEIVKWKLVHGVASRSHNRTGMESFLIMDDNIVT
jgi:hypothetical protein